MLGINQKTGKPFVDLDDDLPRMLLRFDIKVE